MPGKGWTIDFDLGPFSFCRNAGDNWSDAEFSYTTHRGTDHQLTSTVKLSAYSEHAIAAKGKLNDQGELEVVSELKGETVRHKLSAAKSAAVLAEKTRRQLEQQRKDLEANQQKLADLEAKAAA